MTGELLNIYYVGNKHKYITKFSHEWLGQNAELDPGRGRYKKIVIGRPATAASRHATLESDSAVPSSTAAKIIKEITAAGVPPLRQRRSKTVALRPGVTTRGAAGKHLPRHSYFFFPSQRCRKNIIISKFQNISIKYNYRE